MSHDSDAHDQHRSDDDAGRGPAEGGRPRDEHPGRERREQEYPGQGRPGEPRPGAAPWNPGGGQHFNPAPGQPWGPEWGAFWAPQWGPQWGPGWSSPQAVEGRRHADNALILGILSVVVLPLLGPFAIWQAREAEKLGISATVGKVLGWVGTVMIAVFLFFLVAWLAAFGFFMVGSAGGS
ncbi:DUF4190 domain-containing protein [Kocuria sp. M1R5S2]|uniref:DUF4190 domain-containing protein n=1 Tax=Kocuria rhizosphaerae TaxID=3376285 RepID=UPI0037B9EFA0